jgi:hypothetical protein
VPSTGERGVATEARALAPAFEHRNAAPVSGTRPAHVMELGPVAGDDELADRRRELYELGPEFHDAILRCLPPGCLT